MTRLETAAAPTPVTNDVFLPPPQQTPHIRRQLDDLLQEVADIVSPVWPLKDYVAVNPYSGLSERPFLEARSFLQLFSDCETLMPVAHYAEQFQQGRFGLNEIQAAIDEVELPKSDDQVWSVSAIVEKLQAAVSAEAGNGHRVIRTMAEYADRQQDLNWSEVIRDEISKHCGPHYDEGQASWKSPWKGLPLYQAWRSASAVDRNVETLGLKKFRSLVNALPHSADAAIVCLLQRLQVPEPLWQPMLLCQAFSIPGWSAWTKYQSHWTDDQQAEHNDFAGLLAIRLAYDVAVSEVLGIKVDWQSVCRNESASFRTGPQDNSEETSLRYLLLRASEIAYRDQLVASLSTDTPNQSETTGKLAQMVFCIDVRSERIRRHLESQSSAIETFGFAGFFGMPAEFVPLGARHGNSHLPVLLKPQFQLQEGLQETETAWESEAIGQRAQVRSWRKLWKGFQSSAVGCFSFVEMTGLLYAGKLFTRAIGWRGQDVDAKYDGVLESDRQRLGPTLRGLNHQGITTSQQTDLAESMLKNLGLTDNFARLVVFCGHASQTENNPLAAGLDCGACGGHSGEPNARFAALLLNQPYIREALATRGILIPEDTYFLGGLHNTTTDDIKLFDLASVPPTHRDDVQQLLDATSHASLKTGAERMPVVASETLTDLMRRAVDWSEVRPEWGLAGNAAFIVGPRSLTQHMSLDGRAFLHSYDHHQDPHGTILETIMTAPMIVAHWINMQYYASTVDGQHFGSGNKTIHNVVGKFGILSGNGGDLMTGLPWQSLHTGQQHQHLPVRLQVVIAAPRESIDRVINAHELVANLLTNGWLHLVAIEEAGTFQYKDDAWQPLKVGDASVPSCSTSCAL